MSNPPPVMGYRGRPDDPKPPPSSAPITADWVVLLVGHAMLTLVGAAMGLPGVLVIDSIVRRNWNAVGPSLLCCGLPAVLGVLCLWVGVRGMCPLGRGKV